MIKRSKKSIKRSKRSIKRLKRLIFIEKVVYIVKVDQIWPFPNKIKLFLIKINLNQTIFYLNGPDLNRIVATNLESDSKMLIKADLITISNEIWLKVDYIALAYCRPSKLNFNITISPHHWSSILVVHFNTQLIGLILSCQHWSSSSILRWTVNIYFQFWGKRAVLKFNIEVLKACLNEALKS